MKLNNLGKNKGHFLIVTTDEALRIIKSLTKQMIEKSANAGRVEFVTSEGQYFSIGVKNSKDENITSMVEFQERYFPKSVGVTCPCCSKKHTLVDQHGVWTKRFKKKRP